MDGITLDKLIAELREALVGRHLGRPRAVAPYAVVFEVSGGRDRRLWLDAARGSAGVYLLTRAEMRALEALAYGETTGRSRHALLLLRKHLDGRRVTGLRRVAGERTVALDAAACTLALRISGPAPALTLAVEGVAVATVGAGPQAWPLPAPDPGREWDRLEPAALTAAIDAAGASGRTPARSILAACPPLGPLLARELDGTPGSLEALRARLAAPVPTLLAPGPLDRCRDAELAAEGAVALAPIALPTRGGAVLHPSSWVAAAQLFLGARRRGACFDARRRVALASARAEVRRLAQLEVHLSRDLAGLPDAEALRRQGEALLTGATAVQAGASEAEVPDPYDSDRRLVIRLDPALAAPANATRIFEKARRIVRGRKQIEARLVETRAALEAARARELGLLEARDLSEIDSAAGPERPGEPGPARGKETAGPRHYLSSHGLSILVGRTARENHHLTFGVARPDDLWLHARDVPGAHVILRDGEGRADADDLREAAEVAAFFSEAWKQAQADVHVARRKNVKAGRGALGRVRVGHSDTLRVAPRDPKGRLRKR